MAGSAVQPLVWMRLVRDHTAYKPAVQTVLDKLALRMRKEGCGFCAEQQLMEDAGVSRSTVSRALKTGREDGWLYQTRRGHRVTDGTHLASEWVLTDPTQCVNSDALASKANGSSERPNVSSERPNVSPVTPPEVFTQSSGSDDPGGHRSAHPDEPQLLEDLGTTPYTQNPFKFGKEAAELRNRGMTITRGDFLEALNEHFGPNDQRQAFAGFDKYVDDGVSFVDNDVPF